MKISSIFVFLIVLLFPFTVFAHSGNTDSYGGHNKTSNGTYHCHSGQCLEDAKQEAYDSAFPVGQENGRIGENHSDEIAKDLYDHLDPDIAEYMVPYVLEAYQMGYEDTYVPTFWEKYKWYIVGLSICIVFGIIFGVIKLKSKLHKKDHFTTG